MKSSLGTSSLPEATTFGREDRSIVKTTYTVHVDEACKAQCLPVTSIIHAVGARGNMKVLVTGASGKTGLIVLRKLLERDQEFSPAGESYKALSFTPPRTMGKC
eukprot:4838206-Pyramimonas_sp.AAC.1